MGVTAGLLGALITQIGIPELTTWLSGLNAPVTDATILAKLASDTNLGEQIGQAWLAAHPATAPASS